MAVFVNDSFTDTNGTNLYSHVGETGASWSEGGWQSAPSVFAINTNRVHCTNLGTARASGVPATAEYSVEAVLTVVTATTAVPGVIARGDTGTTYYRATIRMSDGSLTLQRVVGGSITALGSTSLGARSGNVTLTLDCYDATKTVKVDGVQKLSSSDNTITSAGAVGIYWSGGTNTSTTGPQFDSFTATDLSTAPVGRRFWSFSQIVE